MTCQARIRQSERIICKERMIVCGIARIQMPELRRGDPFDSGTQKMKCPFCEAEFDVGALKALDEQLNSMQPDDLSWETRAGTEWREGETDSLRVYSCKSCGGEIVGDANLAATSCPFCNNPVVMMGQLSGNLRPDYVIPFQLDKKAAKEGLARHLKGKPFLPKVFKSQNRIDEIKGVYVPFWLFDADADASACYKAERVLNWSDSNYNYVKTDHYMLYRAGRIGFDHIPVDGSKNMPDDLMESIEPYQFQGAAEFQTAYLAGYIADKYDVTAEQSIGRANERVKRSAEAVLASTTSGYSIVVPQSSSARISNGKAKYVLYPVWLLNTTWNGKQYTFAMNGQTGKFVGDLPLDKASLWKWRAILTVALTPALSLLLVGLMG